MATLRAAALILNGVLLVVAFSVLSEGGSRHAGERCRHPAPSQTFKFRPLASHKSLPLECG